MAHSVVVLIASVASGGGLLKLANNTLGLLGKIGALLLVVFIGHKALGHIAQDQFGKAIGLIVMALIPGLFLFAPGPAESLLRSTISSLTGGVITPGGPRLPRGCASGGARPGGVRPYLRPSVR